MQEPSTDATLYREIRTDQDGMPHRDLYTYTLKTRSKVFYFDLRENDNGRYLKITEKSVGKRNQIMVPEEGLEEFRETLNRVMDFP